MYEFMAKGVYISTVGSDDDKAGYNQSGRITEVLGNLRVTFISNMMDNNYYACLDVIRNVLNVISGKAKEDDVGKVNETIYEIETKLETAEVTFIYNGKRFYKNYLVRKETKRMLEDLYRSLERLQDKCGYGMISQEDPRLAVLKR